MVVRRENVVACDKRKSKRIGRSCLWKKLSAVRFRFPWWKFNRERAAPIGKDRQVSYAKADRVHPVWLNGVENYYDEISAGPTLSCNRAEELTPNLRRRTKGVVRDRTASALTRRLRTRVELLPELRVQRNYVVFTGIVTLPRWKLRKLLHLLKFTHERIACFSFCCFYTRIFISELIRYFLRSCYLLVKTFTRTLRNFTMKRRDW